MAWHPFRRKPADGAEERSISLPWQPIVPFNIGPDRFSGAGLGINQALSLSPVYAAVRIIAQDMSTLPLHAFRKSADAAPIQLGKLPQLFDGMTTDGTLVPWIFRCVTSLLLRGNAYGLITSRDGYGYPTAIVWLNPADVSHSQDPGTVDWSWKGRPVAREDMVHIPWFVLPGQVDGLSPIGAFATTMGIGLRSQHYQEEWFSSGGTPPGTFRNTQKQILDHTEAATVQARLVAAIRGRQPVVYGSDWEYTPITMPSGEAQFVTTMQMTANQIAPIYGVRPERIGGDAGTSLNYSTVEGNQLEYTTTTLRFWCELLEGVFFALLPQSQYVKFNMDAIVRADLRTRWEVHRMARQIGAMNIDEIRALEEMPPLPNGEGKDYMPLHTLGQQDAQIAGPASSAPMGEGNPPTAAAQAPSANGKLLQLKREWTVPE